MNYKRDVYLSSEYNENILYDKEMNDYAYITFTKKKTKKRIQYVFKGIIFILIASLSGAAAGAYMVYKKYSSILDQNTKYFTQSNSSPAIGLYNSTVRNVAETIIPTLVGVSGQGEDAWADIGQCSTGIIFSADGYIVTSSSVIDNNNQLSVRLYNGDVYKARVVGKDSITGLAVIKIKAENLVAATFEDSSKVKIGDLAIAVGNPLGEERGGSVTAGIVSSLNKKVFITDENGKSTLYNAIETDAGINIANRDGAICNENGKIIGINNLKINSDLQNRGMGYALSSSEARKIIDSIMDIGYVSRASMGVYGGNAVPEDHNSVTGIYVQQVIRGSGAEKAGIRPTDIILSINNKSIKSMEELVNELQNHKAGEIIICGIWRNGKLIKTNVVLSELKTR